MLRVQDHYAGFGTLEKALHRLGFGPEDINLLTTEYDSHKRKLWDQLHGDNFPNTHREIDDATSPELTPEYTRKVLGGRTHLYNATPSCRGFSKLGKGEGLDHPESKFFIDSNAKRIRDEPESWMHEITSGMADDHRKTLDIMLGMNDQEHTDFIHKTGWRDPALINQLHKQMKEQGRTKGAYVLYGGQFLPSNQTHDYRVSYDLNPRYKPSKERTRSQGRLRDELVQLQLPQGYLKSNQSRAAFDPNHILNREIQPGDNMWNTYSTDPTYNREYTGPIKRFSAKRMLGRYVAGADDSASSNTQNYKGNYGGPPMVLRVLDDAEKQDALTGRFDPFDKQYFVHDPARKYFSREGFVVSHDALSAQSPLVKPGEIYGVDKLSPREVAVINGWDAKDGDTVAAAASKMGKKRGNLIAEAFGDAMPVQHMMYLLLHNPILWREYPEKMAKAQAEFKAFPYSDISVKNILSDGNMKQVFYPKRLIDSIRKY